MRDILEFVENRISELDGEWQIPEKSGPVLVIEQYLNYRQNLREASDLRVLADRLKTAIAKDDAAAEKAREKAQADEKARKAEQKRLMQELGKAEPGSPAASVILAKLAKLGGN